MAVKMTNPSSDQITPSQTCGHADIGGQERTHQSMSTHLDAYDPRSVDVVLY